MYIYCENEVFAKLVDTNIITIKIFYYLAGKCKNAGINKTTFSYKELQDVLKIGHTSVARSIKTLKELDLIRKVDINKSLPEYELPQCVSGMVNFNFAY